MPKKFISDVEMQQLESKGKATAPKFIPDSQADSFFGTQAIAPSPIQPELPRGTATLRNYFDRVRGEQTEAAGDIISGIGKGADIASEGIRKINEAPTLGGKLRGGVEVIGGYGRAGLRTLGGVAGAAFAPITEAPGVKQSLDFIAGQVTKIPGVQDVVENATELAEKYPEQAKNIKNVVDIVTLVLAAKTKTKVDEGTSKGSQKLGEVLEESGKKTIKAEKESFVRKLVKPFQTKKVKEAQVPRTTEKGRGIFKRSEIAPTPAELRAERAVFNIEGVSSKKTVQQNFNIIQEANRKKALSLVDDIAANNFKVAEQEMLKTMDDILAKVQASPLITGDAEKTASKLWEGMRKFLNQNEKTGSGILKARKEYDAWVRSIKPSAFDAKAESAFTVANREIRNGINGLLDAKAPVGTGIKESLAEQSALFNAMNNLVPKAALEADTALGRALQNIGKVLGTKNKAVQIAAAGTGIGGLGAAAKFAPAVAVLGVPAFLIWKGGKYIVRPEIRIAIGQLLQNQAISAVDRSVLIGVLSDYAEDR